MCVCCVSSEMYFPLHKKHGRRTVRPVTWTAKNSRTDKCHINHYSFKFHISFKRCCRKKWLWTTSPVRCLWIFHTTSFLSQIILFYWSLHNIKTSSSSFFLLLLRLLLLSTALQLIVQSFGLPSHFHLPLSWTGVFQFGTFNLCISFLTSSSQRIFGLPVGLFEMGFQACIALTILVSCILSIWPLRL